MKTETPKNYRHVVILQTFIILISLTFKDILHHFGFENPMEITKVLFLLFGGIYLFFLWDLLREFTSNKWLIRFILGLILTTYFIGFLITNPLFQIWELDPESRQIWFLILHTALFIIEITLIYFTSLDLFKGKDPIDHKLWGAACVYLMIGLSFGSAYDIICLINPGSLGEPLTLGLPNYMESIYYSMNVLGSLDTAYPDAHRLIRNLGIAESMWGNLFIIILIGRLLIRSGEASRVAGAFKNSIETSNNQNNPFFRILWMQILLIMLGLTFSYIPQLLDKSWLTPPIHFFLLLLFGGYMLSLWDLLRQISNSGILSKTVLVTLIIAYVITFITVNPFGPLIATNNREEFLLLVHFPLLAIQILVISFAIPEVFSGHVVNISKLSGTASLYLMIALAFASVFELMNLLIPGCFGPVLEPGYESYIESFYYSMHTLSSLDSDYPNASRLVRNTGVIEAVWGELFIAILVGNLLSKPEGT